MTKYLLTFFALAFTLCFGLSQNQLNLSKEKAVSDIEFLIKTIEDVHYDAYFKTTKSKLISEKNEITQSWKSDSVSLKQLMVAGMKLSALLSNGHTSLSWQNPLLFPELIGHSFIPFKIKAAANNTFYISKSAIEQLREGDQLVAINGIKMEELFQECMSYTGGIKSFKKASCEITFPLFLFFNEKIKAPYTLELTGDNSVVLEKTLNVQELQNFLASGTDLENYSFDILDENIGYIAYNSCQGEAEFKQFLRKTFKTIRKKKVNKLIIDIRKNGGGNSSLNDMLLAYITRNQYRQSSGRYWKVSDQVKEKIKNDSLWIGFLENKFLEKYNTSAHGAIIEDLDFELTSPKKTKNSFEGKTCVLIGPNTFSSANFLADAIKTYKLSTLIGSATGEYTNDFGEQINFKLPNSGNDVYVSSTYDIGANGKANTFEPVYPDIEVENDVLEFAIHWINKD